jgi:hypothetical protein
VRLFLVILFAAGVYGAIEWQLHDRAIPHGPGVLVAKTPSIAQGSSRIPWQDAHGFRYTALADFDFRAIVLSRKNYAIGEFAGLSPTDLAIGWGELSDPGVYGQFRFDQRGSPLAGRFVLPEIVPGSPMARRPTRDIEAFLLAHLTHVHTIPATADVERRLAGIRPGQLVHLKGVLVEAQSSSDGIYRSSLALFDHDCEIMWVDDVELE